METARRLAEWAKDNPVKTVAACALAASVLLAARPGQKLPREATIKALQDVSEEFHGIFTEMALCVQSMQRKLEAQGGQSKLSPEQWSDLLMQRGLSERLEEAQAQVALKHGITVADLATSQAQLQHDPQVKLYAEGIKKMHDECFTGQLPCMPGVEVPPELTKERMLGFAKQIVEEKHKRISAAVKAWHAQGKPPATPGSPIPPPELTQAIQDAYDSAETTVIEATGYSPIVFKTAHAAFLRDPDFAAEKAAIDKAFQEQFKAALAPKQGAEIDQTSADELSERLSSCESMKTPLVCCVVDEAASAALKDLQSAVSTFPKDWPFVWIKQEDASSLDVLSKVPVNSYVFFDGVAPRAARKAVNTVDQLRALAQRGA